MHLLIIDGLNLIRRIHAAVPGEGMEAVSAALDSCAHSLNNLMSRFQPSHAVCCFDGPELSWRHLQYPDYKANRKPMPMELADSLPAFRQQFANQGIASLALATVEADDLAATLVNKMLSIEGRVTLVSTDKGFAQLLPSETDAAQSLCLWNHFDKQQVDADSVRSRFAVNPAQLTDYWGLVGDATNHIPGVRGIGAKTAAQLLQRFRDLDDLYAQLDDLSSAKQQQLLREQQEQARLSKRLATLDQHLDLGCNLRDFRCSTGSYGDTAGG